MTTDRSFQVVEFTSPVPWLGRDLARLVSSFAIGLIGVGVSWVGVDGSEAWSTQTAWVAFGVGATAVSAVGAGGWVLVGLRSVRRLRGVLLDGLRVSELHRPQTGSDSVPSPGWVVTATGMTVFHMPDCLLVAGKASRSLDRGEAEALGLRPCRMCRC